MTKKKFNGRFTPPGTRPRTSKARVPRSNICPYCRIGPANTVQDVLPLWARERFKTIGEFPKNQVPSETVKICRTCNQADDHLYQNTAAPLMGPMMEGTPAVLPPTDQETTALWIVKTILEVTLLRTNLTLQERNLATGMLQEMLRRRSMSVHAFVRIGAIEPSNPDGAAHDYLFPPMQLPAALSFGVFVLGAIVLEAAMGDEVRMATVQSLPDNDTLVRIWPVQIKDIEWPPRVHMNNEDVFRLRQAWTAEVWPPPPGQSLDVSGLSLRRASLRAFSPEERNNRISERLRRRRR